MIYFDNGATTNKKPDKVVEMMQTALTKFSANPGRSGHKESLKAAMEIAKVREKIANYFGAERSENVIFTSGCTESLNLAILGTAKKGGHVIATAFEHNSTLRPLFELEKQGIIELTIVSPAASQITASDIIPHIKPNTYLIATVHVSNVDGSETDINSIGKLCKEKGILYLVDSAQSAGHKRINMQKTGINFLAIAGHKGLYGPQGVGALVINGNTFPKPIKFGGTGTESISVYQPSESPECYESGTIATPNILALSEGISFVEKYEEKIISHEKFLTKYALDKLKTLKNIKIYTKDDNLNGVIAFNVKDVDSNDVSEFLDDNDICVRGGLHCAPLKHKFLGTTNQGVVRMSFSYFNTTKEVDMFIRTLNIFINHFA